MSSQAHGACPDLIGSLCDVGHQGLLHDKEFGLIHNRARSLHPRLGRFLQRDPLGYVDGMSFYEYVRSTPLLLRDPTGLKSKTIVSEEDVTSGPGRVNDAYDADLLSLSGGRCLLLIHMEIEFEFEGNWSHRGKWKFMREYADTVSKSWSNKYTIWPTDKSDHCCPCRNGTKVQIKTETGLENLTQHWTIIVSDTEKRAYTELDRVLNFFTGGRWKVETGNVYLYMDANKTIKRASEPQADAQASSAHEFGHMIGLNWEEYIPRKAFKSYNTPQKYITKTPWDSIMATGERVYPRHYQPFYDWMTESIQDEKDEWKSCWYKAGGRK